MSFDSGLYTIQQLNTSRYLDAKTSGNFSTSTTVDTSKWCIFLYSRSGVYTIQQKSNDRYLDAYQEADSCNSDCGAYVNRKEQRNSSQKWVLMHLGSDNYTIQQLNSGRFLDAYQATDVGKDYAAVTRWKQDNDTQRWVLLPLDVAPESNQRFRIQQVSNCRYLDAYEDSAKVMQP